MNRAICLALALAAMFAVPEASAEPNKWQYELLERCMKRAAFIRENPEQAPFVNTDHGLNNYSTMLDNENDYRAMLNIYREMLNNYREKLDQVTLERAILNNQTLGSAMLNNYSAMLNNYRTMLNRAMLNNENHDSAMLNKCFYLQIAPG
jgi:hypothetical protein